MNKTIFTGSAVITLAIATMLIILQKNKSSESDTAVVVEEVRTAQRAEPKPSPSIKRKELPKSSSSKIVTHSSDGTVTSSVRTLGAEEAAKFFKDHLKKQKQSKAKIAELKIKELVGKLGLDADQEKALREYMEKKEEALSIFGNMGNGARKGAPADVSEMMPYLQKDHLANTLEPHLSEEQNELLEEHQQNELDNKVDKIALDQISQLQGAVTITAEQREALYEKFANDAIEKESNQTSQDLLLNQLASSMGGGNVQIGLSGNNNQESTIDDEVESVSDILSDVQLEQYRNQLESQPSNNSMSISIGNGGAAGMPMPSGGGAGVIDIEVIGN